VTAAAHDHDRFSGGFCGKTVAIMGSAAKAAAATAAVTAAATAAESAAVTTAASAPRVPR
jgi:hypothetical protein